MLAKQLLKDQQGNPMGVFIPMQSWNNIVFQYPEIENLETEIPQWEKDFIDSRLEMAQNNPNNLKPIENLLDNI